MKILLIASCLALSALPAEAGFIASERGIPKPAWQPAPRAAPQTEAPLLAAVPMTIETEDTSSDPAGTGFVIYTSVNEAREAGSGAYDNFSAYHDVTRNPAEYAYHTQGNPASYNGAPYNNFRGYDNISGYNGSTAYYSRPGYLGGYRY